MSPPLSYFVRQLDTQDLSVEEVAIVMSFPAAAWKEEIAFKTLLAGLCECERGLALLQAYPPLLNKLLTPELKTTWGKPLISQHYNHLGSSPLSWMVCSKRGNVLLGSHHGLLEYLFDPELRTAWGRPLSSGPYPGSSPLYWICVTEENVKLLIDQLLKNPERVKSVLFHPDLYVAWGRRPNSSTAVPAKEASPFYKLFYWLCMISGPELLAPQTLDDLFEFLLAPELRMAWGECINSEPEAGFSPLYYVCSTSEGIKRFVKALMTDPEKVKNCLLHPDLYPAWSQITLSESPVGCTALFWVFYELCSKPLYAEFLRSRSFLDYLLPYLLAPELHEAWGKKSNPFDNKDGTGIYIPQVICQSAQGMQLMYDTPTLVAYMITLSDQAWLNAGNVDLSQAHYLRQTTTLITLNKGLTAFHCLVSVTQGRKMLITCPYLMWRLSMQKPEVWVIPAADGFSPFMCVFAFDDERALLFDRLQNAVLIKILMGRIDPSEWVKLIPKGHNIGMTPLNFLISTEKGRRILDELLDKFPDMLDPIIRLPIEDWKRVDRVRRHGIPSAHDWIIKNTENPWVQKHRAKLGELFVDLRTTQDENECPEAMHDKITASAEPPPKKVRYDQTGGV